MAYTSGIQNLSFRDLFLSGLASVSRSTGKTGKKEPTVAPSSTEYQCSYPSHQEAKQSLKIKSYIQPITNIYKIMKSNDKQYKNTIGKV